MAAPLMKYYRWCPLNEINFDLSQKKTNILYFFSMILQPLISVHQVPVISMGPVTAMSEDTLVLVEQVILGNCVTQVSLESLTHLYDSCNPHMPLLGSSNAAANENKM